MNAPPRASRPPSLELDWEERLFTGLRALWRRWRSAPVRPDPGYDTSLLLPRLLLPVQLLAGWPCRLATAQGCGGLQPEGLVLPAFLPQVEDADAALDSLLAFSLLGAQMLAREDLPDSQAPGLLLLDSLRRAAEARRELLDEWPGARPLLERSEARARATRPELDRLPEAARVVEELRQLALAGGQPWLQDKWRRRLGGLTVLPAESPPLSCWPEWLAVAAVAGGLGIPADLQQPESSTGTEVEMPARTDIEQVRLSGKDLQEQVLQHIFEKVQTADEYRGGTRQTDGEDELQDQLEALQEVDLRHVIRGGEAAQSILRADLRLDPGIPDVADEEAEGGLPYPEWDQRSGRHREAWCRVFPAQPRATDAGWAAGRLPELEPQIRRLQRVLERERERPEPVPRQEDGEQLDTDAYAEDAGSLRAGHDAAGRWYVQDRRKRPDLALTLLLDVSLSSDAWVGERRVLDLCKDAALVLGEVMRRLGEELEILAFHSRTRHHCRVWRVHERGGDWSLGRARLGGLQPEGYTRMGPALRYATDRLAAVASRRRLLLVITDGRPTDFDRYEGRHGMADVRHALREARSRGVHTHALALDPRARAALPSMLGDGHWQLLRRPAELPDLLTTIYGRLSV
ncbi:MAG: VWA domain-containing protein [Candidatus Delongbacteria bacterium]